MRTLCFVCNEPADNANKNLLAESESELKILGPPILKLLSEIFNKTIPKTELHSEAVCNKCVEDCYEYHRLNKKLSGIKKELTDHFKSTLKKHGHDFAFYPGKTAIKITKNIVLPASKLQPLPPDYALRFGNIASLSPKKEYNLRNNLSHQKFIRVPAASTSKIVSNVKVTESSDSIEKTVNKTLAAILNSDSGYQELSKSSVKSRSPYVLLKDIKISKSSTIKRESDLGLDENAMGSVEHCDQTKGNIKENDGSDREVEKEEDEPKVEFLDVNLLGLDENDNGESNTIMVSEDNGSVFRIVSGQKLVLENGDISFSVEDDDDDDLNDDSNDDDDITIRDDDERDSNDESQIELQVSGDEETANAIIAAAKEQGGAFIKVESGEMYQVKSVQSKSGESRDDSAVMKMVEVQDEKFKCLVCERSGVMQTELFPNAQDMMTHLKLTHGALLYICQKCKLIMRRRIDYNKHMEEHMDNKLVINSDRSKMHECKVCKKKYISKMLLEEHMNIHTGRRPYSCNTCGKTFTSRYTLQAHVKTHMDRPRPFKCKYNKCSKSFFTATNLSKHEKIHTGVKDFVCSICDKAFVSQHNLEVHGVVHTREKPFVCGVCNKAFARKNEVKDHLRTHTGERPFKCDTCGARFSQRSNLQSHKRATHYNDRRHVCTHPGCDKRFKRRRLLEYHQRALHTGERPLRCESCPATFVYPEHYKKHMRTHTGERPFECEVCGKSFNSRDNRNTHRFVHSDKKPYECLVCGAGYMRKQLLYAHMNSSGHLAESIVINQPRVQDLKGKKRAPKFDKVDKNENMGSNIVTADATNIELYQNSDNLDAGSQQDDNTPKLILTGDKKFILQDGSQTINFVQETDDPALLSFMHTYDQNASGKLDEHQNVAAEHNMGQVQMITTDENGEIRLVQLHLNSDHSSYIAVNQ